MRCVNVVVNVWLMRPTKLFDLEDLSLGGVQ